MIAIFAQVFGDATPKVPTFLLWLALAFHVRNVGPASGVRRAQISPPHLPASVFVNLSAKLNRVLSRDAVDLIQRPHQLLISLGVFDAAEEIRLARTGYPEIGQHDSRLVVFVPVSPERLGQANRMTTDSACVRGGIGQSNAPLVGVVLTRPIPACRHECGQISALTIFLTQFFGGPRSVVRYSGKHGI